MKKNKETDKIKELKDRIARLKTDKKFIEESLFGDRALVEHLLYSMYRELGELYLKQSELTKAIDAFKQAKKHALKFDEEEWFSDPDMIKKEQHSTRKYWDEKIKRLKEKAYKNN